MNNLTQTQTDTKQAFLNYQSEQMLALYEKADTDERKAIIKQIDSFLSVVSKDGKIFWLKFRRKLEMLNESKVLFPLGNVYLTAGAREILAESDQQPIEFLARHQSGDYGIFVKKIGKRMSYQLETRLDCYLLTEPNLVLK
jgi:hypothetical protein